MELYDVNGIGIFSILKGAFFENIFFLELIVVFYFGILADKYFFQQKNISQGRMKIFQKIYRARLKRRDQKLKNILHENKKIKSEFKKYSERKKSFELAELMMKKDFANDKEIIEAVREIYKFLASQEEKKSFGLNEAVFMMRNMDSYNFFAKENGKVMFERKIEVIDSENIFEAIENQNVEKKSQNIIEEKKKKHFKDLSEKEQNEFLKSVRLPKELQEQMLIDCVNGSSYIYSPLPGLTVSYNDNGIEFISSYAKVDLKEFSIAYALPRSSIYSTLKIYSNDGLSFKYKLVESSEAKAREKVLETDADEVENRGYEESFDNDTMESVRKKDMKEKMDDFFKNASVPNDGRHKQHTSNEKAIPQEAVENKEDGLKRDDMLLEINSDIFTNTTNDIMNQKKEDYKTNQIVEENKDGKALIGARDFFYSKSSFDQITDFFNHRNFSNPALFKEWFFAHIFSRQKYITPFAYIKKKAHTDENIESCEIYIDIEFLFQCIANVSSFRGIYDKCYSKAKNTKRFIQSSFINDESIATINFFFSEVFGESVRIEKNLASRVNMQSGEVTDTQELFVRVISKQAERYFVCNMLRIKIDKVIFESLSGLIHNINSKDVSFLFADSKKGKALMTSNDIKMINYKTADIEKVFK